MTAEEVRMSIWWLLLIICGCGAIGGLLNALFSEDRGFKLPQLVEGIWRPGWLGNVFVGAAAAGIFWTIYGPFAESFVIGTDPSDVASAVRESSGKYGEKLAGLGGAVLSGIAGARLLTQLVDKKFFQAAAVRAAASQADEDKSKQIALSSPVEALRLARLMSPQ